MVEFNDRRNSLGSGDFNNPKGTFEIVSPGDEEYSRWTGKNVDKDSITDVRSYFTGQKDTQTWAEANRLAAKRASYEARRHGHKDAAAYADSYHDHLVRVMAMKGPSLADKFGELQHRQSGYGRT